MIYLSQGVLQVASDDSIKQMLLLIQKLTDLITRIETENEA